MRYAAAQLLAYVEDGLWLKNAARAIAEVVPDAQHRELAGQTHNVQAGVLAPPVVEFVSGQSAAISI